MAVPCNSDVAVINDVAWSILSIAMAVTTPTLNFEGQTMFCNRRWDISAFAKDIVNSRTDLYETQRPISHKLLIKLLQR